MLAAATDVHKRPCQHGGRHALAVVGDSYAAFVCIHRHGHETALHAARSIDVVLDKFFDRSEEIVGLIYIADLGGSRRIHAHLDHFFTAYDLDCHVDRDFIDSPEVVRYGLGINNEFRVHPRFVYVREVLNSSELGYTLASLQSDTERAVFSREHMGPHTLMLE